MRILSLLPPPLVLLPYYKDKKDNVGCSQQEDNHQHSGHFSRREDDESTIECRIFKIVLKGQDDDKENWRDEWKKKKKEEEGGISWHINLCGLFNAKSYLPLSVCLYIVCKRIVCR